MRALHADQQGKNTQAQSTHCWCTIGLKATAATGPLPTMPACTQMLCPAEMMQSGQPHAVYTHAGDMQLQMQVCTSVWLLLLLGASHHHKVQVAAPQHHLATSKAYAQQETSTRSL
jgi:hypothetical protein